VSDMKDALYRRTGRARCETDLTCKPHRVALTCRWLQAKARPLPKGHTDRRIYRTCHFLPYASCVWA
jgi:hypothetical protein